MEEPPRKSVFDKNLSEIPCFRDSYLYGIFGGIGGGLLYFMWTSRPRLATHFGVASFAITTLSYWAFCRHQWEQTEKQARVLKQYMKEHIIKEGTEDVPILGEAVSV